MAAENLAQQTTLSAPSVADILWAYDMSATAGSRDRKLTLAVLADFLGVTSVTISQAGHGFTVGQFVRHDGTDYVLADASGHDDAFYAGMVVEVVDTGTFRIKTSGLATGLSGLTGGSVHYLRADGTVNTQPGEVHVPCLLALSSSVAYIYPPTTDRADRFLDIGDAGSSVTIDWRDGETQTILLTTSTTITFTGYPPSGRLRLIVTEDATGAHSITWPSSVQWPGGTPPVLTAAGDATDIFDFHATNGGATVYGMTFGLDYGADRVVVPKLASITTAGFVPTVTAV